MAYQLMTDRLDALLLYKINKYKIVDYARVIVPPLLCRVLEDYYCKGTHPCKTAILLDYSAQTAYLHMRNYYDKLKRVLEFMSTHSGSELPLTYIRCKGDDIPVLRDNGIVTIGDYSRCTTHWLVKHCGLYYNHIHLLDMASKIFDCPRDSNAKPLYPYKINIEYFDEIVQYMQTTGCSVETLFQYIRDYATRNRLVTAQRVLEGKSLRDTAGELNHSPEYVRQNTIAVCKLIHHVSIPIEENGGKLSRDLSVMTLGSHAKFLTKLDCKTVGDVMEKDPSEILSIPNYGPTKYKNLLKKLKEVV